CYFDPAVGTEGSYGLDLSGWPAQPSPAAQSQVLDENSNALGGDAKERPANPVAGGIGTGTAPKGQVWPENIWRLPIGPVDAGKVVEAYKFHGQGSTCIECHGLPFVPPQADWLEASIPTVAAAAPLVVYFGLEELV